MGSLLVDVNNKADRDFAQNCAFPSNRYDELTLSSSGTEYTAPENGWFSMFAITTAAGGWFRMLHETTGLTNWEQCTNSGWTIAGNIPCSKGQKIQVQYENINPQYFRFIYAKGAE